MSSFRRDRNTALRLAGLAALPHSSEASQGTTSDGTPGGTTSVDNRVRSGASAIEVVETASQVAGAIPTSVSQHALEVSTGLSACNSASSGQQQLGRRSPSIRQKKAPPPVPAVSTASVTTRSEVKKLFTAYPV